MRIPRTALLSCGVVAVASCTPSGITLPESAAVGRGEARQADTPLVPHAPPVDTAAARPGGVFGMGSGG